MKDQIELLQKMGMSKEHAISFITSTLRDFSTFTKDITHTPNVLYIDEDLIQDYIHQELD